MGKTFIYADPHFGHTNIMKYAQRPWTDVNKMDRDLIRLFNDTVGKDDLTYILGDVTLKGAENLTWLTRIIHSLNGRKVLIFGNHDQMKWDQYLHAGFESCHTYLELQDKFVFWSDGKDGSKSVRKVSPVRLCHDPAWAQDKNSLWVCGHLHNCAFTAPTHIAIVCVELTEYRPVLLNDIVDGLRPGGDVLRTPPRPNREPKEWKEKP